MNNLENKIRNIVKKELSSKQTLLKVKGDQNSGYICIVIDGEKNVSLNETAYLTKILKKSIELEALFPGGYRLEVTSPGIDYPLEFPFQYKKNIGKNIKISYLKKDKKINSTALITDANKKFVFLKVNNEDLKLNYSNINLAKLKITFN